MIVAVDGPAGSGKSTVCRRLALELGYAYLDTGSMYRAVAYALSQEGIPWDVEALIDERISGLPLRFAVEDGAMKVYHREALVGPELRGAEAARGASTVSQLGAVRRFLTERQRMLGKAGRMVAEGRDMGTVVFPDAPVKVFLTASIDARTRRRMEDYRARGVPADYDNLAALIHERDEADSRRELAPLKAAHDAVVLDTSDLSFEEVVERLLILVREKAEG